jgi:hypothetical protein
LEENSFDGIGPPIVFQESVILAEGVKLGREEWLLIDELIYEVGISHQNIL